MKTRVHLSAMIRRPAEGGSTLPFAMTIITVLGITLAAGLPQSQTSIKVHEAYEQKRTFELSSADGAVEKQIQTIRYDGSFGVAGSGGDCSDPNAMDSLGTLPASEGGFEVLCKPDPTSGTRLNQSSASPPEAIVTLGGQAKQWTLDTLGKSYTAPGLFKEQPDDPTGVGAFRYPACADMHGFQAAGTDRCEAGMLVGRGTDPESGGLYIANNGTNTTGPLVISNSSIIASNSGGFGRELFVEGGIRARAFCGAGSGIHAGTLDASKIHANVSGPGNPGQPADCGNTPALKLDPGYPRAPFKLPEWHPYSAVNKFPCVGAGACLRAVTGGDLAPSTLCADGLVKMPADEIGGAGSGWYGAWYTSSFWLNNLMSAPECRDALFWFRPGVYYFDFLDANNGPAWEAPLGCLSADGTCTSSEIIGGTPVGWNNCQQQPPIAVADCLQPDRVLATSNPSWSADWDLNNTANHTTEIDGDAGTVEIWKDNQNEWIFHDKLQPPIPQRSNTTVQTLRFEIAYSLPNAGSYDDSIKPDGAEPYSGQFGAVLDISSPNNGHCFIHLRPNMPNTMKLVANQNPYRAQTVIDLTNGCNTAQNAALIAANAPYTFLKNDSFPASFATIPGVINQMKARVEVKAKGTVLASNKASMSIDGMQWVVSWKGRPAPPYPNGCDPTTKGVQFVFGSNARIAWGTGSTQNAFVELCALRARDVPAAFGSSYQGAFGSVNHAQVTGNDFGIGMYGLNEDSSPPPKVMSTDPTAGANGRILLPIQFEPGTNDEITSFAPEWQMVDATGATTRMKWGSTNPNNCISTPLPVDTLAYDRCEKDYKTIGDIANARVEAIPWTGNGAASFSFRLAPDLTTNPAAPYYVPPGSTILSVKVKIAHREGARGTTGSETGVYYPANEVVGTTLKVVPGTGGVGSNGMDSWMWHSPDSTTNVSQYPGSMVPCRTGNNMAPAVDNPATPGVDETLPTSTCLTPCEKSAAAYCIFEWGDRTAWNESWQPPADKKTWSYQRSLTDALDTPEALENSLWTWRVNVNSFPGGSTRKHEAALDGIVVEIEYRRSDSPRPLRGCLTTRIGWRPDALLSDGSWTWDRNQGSNLGAGAPGTGTGLPKGYGWYDRDWGARWGGVNGNEYFKTDEAFGDGSANISPGNGNDDVDCPLLELINNKGRVKFHMQGMLYAPSAALSLSGKDNDAQWSTHGIVARHVSAIRWIDPGSDIPAVGDPDIKKNPRKVILELKKNGVVVRRIVVSIDDLQGNSPGFGTDILSWVDNPKT